MKDPLEHMVKVKVNKPKEGEYDACFPEIMFQENMRVLLKYKFP